MKNTLVKSAVLFGTVTAGLVSVAPAHAAGVACPVDGVLAGTPGTAASSCLQFNGNDSNYQEGSGLKGFENYIKSSFGLDPLSSAWKLVDKSDDGSTSTPPAPDIVFASNDQTSGTWGFIQPFHSISSPFVVVLKSGTSFWAYLFEDLSNIKSGTFTVPSGQELSHLSVYNQVGARIPTPALLPGLIAMGAGMLRKRKAKQAVEAEA